MITSSPLAGRPSTVPDHTRTHTTGAKPGLKFGYINPNQDFSGYQDLVKHKNDYGRPFSFEDSIHHANQFTPLTSPLINEAFETVSPRMLKDFLKGAKLGALEEGSDALQELMLYRAIQRGIITPKLIYDVRHKIVNPLRGADFKSPDTPDHPYKDVVQAIIKQIPERDAKRFQKISGDQTLMAAQFRLALGVFKFASLDGETMEQANQIKSKTHKYLINEAEEFKEYLNGHTPMSKPFLMPYTKLFARLSFLPTRLYYVLPLHMIRKELAIPVPKEEMLHFQFLKQLWRQELQYGVGGNERGQKNGGGNQYDYNIRKTLYKPVELVLEGWRLWLSVTQPRKASDEAQAKLYKLA